MREEICSKNFPRQTDLLDIKSNYRHCSISMPVVDTIFTAPEKWTHWRRLDGGGGGQIRPGILFWKQGHGSTAETSPPAISEGKWISALSIPTKTAKIEGRKY
jgi:hypothetical protein